MDAGGRVKKNKWCPGTESNRRHCDFQSHALPTELPGLMRFNKNLQSALGAVPIGAAICRCPPHFRRFFRMRLERRGRVPSSLSPARSVDPGSGRLLCQTDGITVLRCGRKRDKRGICYYELYTNMESVVCSRKGALYPDPRTTT